jgi:hypothetical protein
MTEFQATSLHIEQPSLISLTAEDNSQSHQRVAELEAELEKLQRENSRYESLCKQLQEIVAQQEEEQEGDDASTEQSYVSSIEEGAAGKEQLSSTVTAKRKAADVTQSSSTVQPKASSFNKNRNTTENGVTKTKEQSQKKQKK